LETPWIVELRNQYADKGFEVLGVDSEGDDLKADDKDGFAKQKESVAKFVKLEKMPYPVLLNGDSIAKQYGGLDAMPTSFWVDRSGKVVAAQMGITSKDDMEEKIRKALQ
jgi:glutathione peroxidase-family protein